MSTHDEQQWLVGLLGLIGIGVIGGLLVVAAIDPYVALEAIGISVATLVLAFACIYVPYYAGGVFLYLCNDLPDDVRGWLE